jgi:hypothetical protein
VTIDNATLTNTIGRAVTVTDSSGAISIGVNGPATITTPGNGGLLVTGGAPVFTYSGSITNTSGNAVVVDGTTGGSVTVTNPGGRSTEDGSGIIVRNSQGDVSIARFDITDSTGPGILVQNNKFTGTVATFEDILISNTNTKSPGISLATNTGTVALADIEISTTGGVGLLASTNEVITMTGTNSVTTTDAAAVSFTNGTGVHTLAFSDISSSNSPTNGVLLSGISSGTFDVSGGITVDDAAGPSVLMQNSTLTGNIPTVSITNGAGGGLHLLNMNDASALDTLSIGTATIGTTGGTALLVTNTSPFGGNGLTAIGAGSVTAAGGTAISARNANLTANFSQVSSTGATGTGISLIDSGTTSTLPGIAITSTSVTGVTGTGIFLQGNDPNTPSSGIYADFGTAIIQGTGQSGIFVQNTNASFTGTTIDGFTTGVSLFGDVGEETTFLGQNMNIGTTTAPTTGINILANGSGTVNATVSSNSLNATGDSLSATTSGAGEILLNANANTPATGFNLNNAAGKLGISQGSEAALSSANNGVTVTVTPPASVGFNATVPTP